MKTLLFILIFAAFQMPLYCTALQQPPTIDTRENELNAVVASFLRSKTAGLGWETRIKRLAITGKAALPEGKLDYEVIAPPQWEGWGSVNLTVYARLKDKLVGNISLRADVEALTDMVVTLHQIERDTPLASGDLMLQKREISHNSLRAARSIDEVIGKKARITLKANQPVLVNHIEKVPLIKSGQMVTIVAENDTMKISIAGKARSSGAEGDVISVQNLNSLKEIPARIISTTTVRVAF